MNPVVDNVKKRDVFLAKKEKIKGKFCKRGFPFFQK